MSTTGTVESRGYRLIDADTHVNEPPDLWTSRVASKYRDRVPHMEHFEQGDAWLGEGVTEPINFGFNASATLPRADRTPWVRFEDIPAGGYDPVERLKELDEDLIDYLLERNPKFRADCEAIRQEMRAGKLALIRPVITSTDGRCVARIK